VGVWVQKNNYWLVMKNNLVLILLVFCCMPLASGQTLGLKELQDLALCQTGDCFQNKVEAKDFDFSAITYQAHDTTLIFKSVKPSPSSSVRPFFSTVVFYRNRGWVSFWSISRPYYKAIKDELIVEGYKNIGHSAEGQVLVNDYENETHRIRIGIRNNKSDSVLFYDVSIILKSRFKEYLSVYGARSKYLVEEKIRSSGGDRVEDSPVVPAPSVEPQSKSKFGSGNGGYTNNPNDNTRYSTKDKFKPKVDGFGDRALKVYDAFVDVSNRSGRVVLYVCIDKEGNVTSASYRAAGSTTDDVNLKRKAVENAKSCKFEVGTSDGCGVLTYDFVVR
jgi:hypothetical protein